MRVLVTGAAGRIGRTVLPGLRARDHTVRGLDLTPAPTPEPAEDFLVGDCGDPEVLADALAGTDAVVHLAGNPAEAPLAASLDSHVRVTGRLLDAMVAQGVRRLVYASSNHAVGRTPRSELVDVGVRPRPDGFYGLAKAATEALVSLYVDHYGVQAVCLRIGSFAERPTTRRHLATWLSPRDATELVDASLTAVDLDFAVVYGISANTRRWWDLEPARALGYRPTDDAEAFADEIARSDPGEHENEDAAYVGGYLRPVHEDPGSG